MCATSGARQDLSSISMGREYRVMMRSWKRRQPENGLLRSGVEMRVSEASLRAGETI